MDPEPSRSLALRELARRRWRQAQRWWRKSLRHAVFLLGAAVVAAASLLFAWLADQALEGGQHWFAQAAWAPWLALPFGLAALRWLTLRFAQQARGSGIPQVIAGLSLPAFGPAQSLLVALPQALWKIALTIVALFIGASVGREGPSVQVGAAVMLCWGYWWQRRLGPRMGYSAQALITTGAAGGLAAAFNTPLAGVVFAIEELTRGLVLRWDRLVLSGVLVAGFLSLSVVGNNPYFSLSSLILFRGSDWPWVLLVALVCGIAGGTFARLLLAGPARMLPQRWRAVPSERPVWAAFVCGLLLATIGALAQGTTYGTGYAQASALLNGESLVTDAFGPAKFLATVISYYAGIPGGIFTPSLAIGAGLGEPLGQLIQTVAQVDIDPRVLVLVAMSGFLAGATQAPITAAVIVMEMTHSQQMTFYLLAGALVAAFVSRRLSPRPFYHAAARLFRREAVRLTAPPDDRPPETSGGPEPRPTA